MTVVDTYYAHAHNIAQSGTSNVYLKLTMPTATDADDQYSASFIIVASETLKK